MNVTTQIAPGGQPDGIVVRHSTLDGELLLERKLTAGMDLHAASDEDYDSIRAGERSVLATVYDGDTGELMSVALWDCGRWVTLAGFDVSS